MTFFKWLMARKSAAPEAAAELPAPVPADLPSPAPSTPPIRISNHRPELYTSFPWEPPATPDAPGPAAPDAQGQDETIRLAIATHTHSTSAATLAAWSDLELAQRRAERAAAAKTKTKTTRRKPSSRRAAAGTAPPAAAPALFLPMLPRANRTSPLSRLPASPTRYPAPAPPSCFRTAFPLGPCVLPVSNATATGLVSAVNALLESIPAQHNHLVTDVIGGPLPLPTTVVGMHSAPPQGGGYFSATSVADAMVRILRAHGWQGAFGVGVLRSGRVGRRGRLEWVREVGWAGGKEDESGRGLVAWIYREEGGGQGPLFGAETQWRGLAAWRMAKEKLEVDEEWREEWQEDEMMLQGMRIMEERRNAFGGLLEKDLVVQRTEELTVEQAEAQRGFRPLAW